MQYGVREQASLMLKRVPRIISGKRQQQQSLSPVPSLEANWASRRLTYDWVDCGKFILPSALSAPTGAMLSLLARRIETVNLSPLINFGASQTRGPHGLGLWAGRHECALRFPRHKRHLSRDGARWCQRDNPGQSADPTGQP